jgi:non-specific serine/threonine protein kinase
VNTYDGTPETLSHADVQALLSGSNGLGLIRGRWVEVGRERLERTLERFQEAERLAAQDGHGFAEAMRMLAGTDIAPESAADGADPDWSRVVAGAWLSETLSMANISGSDQSPVARGLSHYSSAPCVG